MNTHYKIGLNALILAILAGISGGIAALFVQISNYVPMLGQFDHLHFVQNLPQTHARMMVFFVIQPALMVGFGSWFVPVLIKSHDMAFRKLSIASFLILIVGFLCNFVTFIHPENATLPLVSLVCWSIASILFSVNMIVTIINHRDPEDSYLKLSIFVWGQGIAAALMLLTASVFLAALTKDYWYASTQLNHAIQQTVRIFAYPLIMILIVPALCLVLHIICTISNRTLKSNQTIVAALTLVTFTILLAWSKMIFNSHIISVSNNVILQIIYACSIYALTLFLSIYCLKLFFTGQRKYPAPILWSFGFVGLLCIGWPYQGMMTEVGLIHSCISYGVLFAAFAGFYFWMGKIIGKQYSELLARTHFVLTGLGVFFSLDVFSLGRSSVFIGSICLGLSLIAFIAMLIHAFCSKTKLSNNYWGEGATSYEWQLPSPVFVRSK